MALTFPNQYVDNGDGLTTIIITKANGAVHLCLIDTADAEIVDFRSWYVHTNGYIRGGCPGVYMHRLLLGAKLVDHANGNKKDNRRANLRSATQRLNMCNSKLLKNNCVGIKGVTFRNNNPRHSTYAVAEAQIAGDKRSKNFNIQKMGLLEATYAAAQYARSLREQLHGEFARHV